MRSKDNPVEIKGQKEGLWIYLDDQVAIQKLLTEIEKKLDTTNNFFADAEVTIDTGTKSFSPQEEQQLRKLVEQQYALRIKNITHTDVREDKEADSHSESEKDDRGDAAEFPEDRLDDVSTDDDEFMKFLDETFRIPVTQKRDQKQTYSSDYLYENEETAFYFRGTIRSGQSLEFPGNVVILGDVNPGAYVIARGDIIVMGRLSGVVHAGAEGEERAVVIGTSFNPPQLRIAQYIGRPPDERPRSRNKRSQTEKAYIKDGTIVIEPIL